MMTEYQRLYCRERSRFRRKFKICNHCGKEPAREDRTLGINCKKRQADNYRRKRPDTGTIVTSAKSTAIALL